MYHLNNYLKKSVIILVLTMFITIPNMRVYSFVGSYQTLSPGIIANNIHNQYTTKEGFLNLPAVLSVGAAVAAFMASITAVAILVTKDKDNRGFMMSRTLAHNHFDRYGKYDFSQFDN